MVRRLIVTPELCSGCRACEVACVAYHEGHFGTATARLKVMKQEEIGLDYPNVCRLCSRPPCVAACPVGALRKDDSTGAILLSEEECFGCGACVSECPFGAVLLHPDSSLALVCDLCGGDPACVKRCATGALLYQEPGVMARQRREAWAIKAWQMAENKGHHQKGGGL